jgi:hypothetical protein
VAEDSVLIEIGFSDNWIKSGIISQENFLSIKENYLKSKQEDANTEHYRYAAFLSFISSNDKIDAEVFFILYELGKNDPDYYMGRSMLFKILDRQDCPIELLDAIISDDTTTFSKHALKIKNNRENK